MLLLMLLFGAVDVLVAAVDAFLLSLVVLYGVVLLVLLLVVLMLLVVVVVNAVADGVDVVVGLFNHL